MSPELYCVELRTQNWDAWFTGTAKCWACGCWCAVIDDGYALLEAGETRLASAVAMNGGEASRRISLAFEVSDVRKICARLEAAGSVVSHPKRDQEGLREANTADPDGNWIRLFSWPQVGRIGGSPQTALGFGDDELPCKS